MKKPVLIIVSLIISLWSAAQVRESLISKLSPSLTQALSANQGDSIDIIELDWIGFY